MTDHTPITAEIRREHAGLTYALAAMQGPAWAQADAATRLYPGHGSVSATALAVTMRAVQLLVDAMPFDNETPFRRSDMVGVLQAQLDDLNARFGDQLQDDDTHWQGDTAYLDEPLRRWLGEGENPR